MLIVLLLGCLKLTQGTVVNSCELLLIDVRVFNISSALDAGQLTDINVRYFFICHTRRFSLLLNGGGIFINMTHNIEHHKHLV